jgi:hypothetical protein
VRHLKPLDEAARAEATRNDEQLRRLAADKAAQLEEIEQIKRQLADLGVSAEELRERARKKGSSFCSVM